MNFPTYMTDISDVELLRRRKKALDRVNNNREPWWYAIPFAIGLSILRGLSAPHKKVLMKLFFRPPENH